MFSSTFDPLTSIPDGGNFTSAVSLSQRSVVCPEDLWSFVGPATDIVYLVTSSSSLVQVGVNERELVQDWKQITGKLTLKHLDKVTESDRHELEHLLLTYSPRTLPVSQRFDLMAEQALSRVNSFIQRETLNSMVALAAAKWSYENRLKPYGVYLVGGGGAGALVGAGGGGCPGSYSVSHSRGSSGESLISMYGPTAGGCKPPLRKEGI